MKVTLLGDSIRMIGYGKRTAELLSPEFTVWQPEENCRFAQYTLRGLWDWAEGMKDSDIIHWNNGLWDVCNLFGDGSFTPLEEYVSLMKRLARLLQQRAKVVIFATTTPVRAENPHNKNSIIDEYNARIVPELQAMGVVINDLNAILRDDIEGSIRADDLIHLTDEAGEKCAQQVAAIIRREAAALR